MRSSWVPAKGPAVAVPVKASQVLPVIHDQHIADELARHAKSMFLTIDFAAIHDSRKAKRSPGNGNLDAAYGIIDYLMIAEQGHRISTGITIEGDANDQFIINC